MQLLDLCHFVSGTLTILGASQKRSIYAHIRHMPRTPRTTYTSPDFAFIRLTFVRPTCGQSYKEKVFFFIRLTSGRTDEGKSDEGKVGRSIRHTWRTWRTSYVVRVRKYFFLEPPLFWECFSSLTMLRNCWYIFNEQTKSEHSIISWKKQFIDKNKLKHVSFKSQLLITGNYI